MYAEMVALFSEKLTIFSFKLTKVDMAQQL